MAVPRADGLWQRLERESWKWAEANRVASRVICEPVIAEILREELGASTEQLVKYYTEEFCALVLRRRVQLAELAQVERRRQAWLRAAQRL